MQNSPFLTVAVALLFFSCPAFAASSERVMQSTPDTLYEWRDWVLFDKEDLLCPTHYNDGDTYRCSWPSFLRLDIDQSGGTFEQEWTVFAGGWQPLPGDAAVHIWPVEVKVDGKPVPITNRNGKPHIHMAAGEHRVAGAFKWEKLPETIPLPPAVGLVELAINGRTVEHLQHDADGRLWLRPREGERGEEDRLQTHVYRLLNDTIPMRITTLLRLEISGRAREIKLEAMLLPDTEPIGLKSPLPARLGPGGELFVQARPGQWELQIMARSAGPVARLDSTGRYAPEIWSFQARNNLRMVEISGAPQVEPAQTDMPMNWRSYPAYLIEDNGGLTFKEIRRGDPDPAPDRLTLARTLWLDFDGRGATLQDRMGGTVSRQWYVVMNPPFDLGRVSVDGRDRVITAHGPAGLAGVELRHGNLNLAAEARYEAPLVGEVPAVGWAHDFQKVAGILNLPPGWRLFASSGVDRMDGSWIQRWSLLDFFVVLIIALAVARLKNLRWGLIALVTMALIFQEPNAPVYVWLHILAAMALLRVLPEGRIKGLVNLWATLAIIFLLIASIPFMVQQIRWGIYPQLEQASRFILLPGTLAPQKTGMPAPESMVLSEDAMDALVLDKEGRTASIRSKASMAGSKGEARKVSSVEQFDPNALVQTGPGLPRWHWRSHRFEWNGPVQDDQTFTLWLIPPWANLLLGILRVLLLGALILGVVGLKTRWEAFRNRLKPGMTAAGMTVLLALLLAPARPHAAAREFPPAELLKQLETRLLEKPDCLPACADILTMALTARPDTLQVLLEVHAAARTALPLPVTPKSWNPQQVIVDQAPARSLARDADGNLWILVPEGIHTVVMAGRIAPGENTVQMPFPLRPHTATYSVEGWQVTGIDPDGRVAGTVQLTAERPAKAKGADDRNNVIPPFLHIRRTLHLGLTWQVSTTVTRITPPGASIVLSMPLLTGESVTTPGIGVRKGAAQLDLGPNASHVQFNSVLAPSSTLVLKAPTAVPWTETWILDASPIWHCETRGIPVIHHQGKQGQWQPEWRPWPGESVEIHATRPEAIPGRSTTLDAVDLTLVPGQRFDRAHLAIAIRTSKGGRHRIELPAKASLQFVKLDGKSLPIRAEENVVSVPLQPGAQDVQVEWRQPAGSRLFIKAPAVKIGGEAVNAQVSFKMPTNLWLIFAGGPPLGPAVLFWSYMIVMALMALALARTRITPLKYASWLLLAVGLTQAPIVAALVVVGWFFALAWRERSLADAGWIKFNLGQVFLVLWTIAALVGLFNAVERGLLGTPDMQIAGNDSTRYMLNWTQDRIDNLMPRPWTLALPMWVYRVFMLVWSLWLAFSLLKWLRWAWTCYSRNGIWKRRPVIKTLS